MLTGTVLSLFPVILCFTFSRYHEVKQCAHFCELDEIEYSNKGRLKVSPLVSRNREGQEEQRVPLTKACFNTKTRKSKDGDTPLLMQDGNESKYARVSITYFLGPQSKYGKLRVLTPTLKESNLILGKQVSAALLKPVPAVPDIKVTAPGDLEAQAGG